VARNLEFKAKVKDLLSLERGFNEHGAVFIEDLEQTDTYFRVSNGRLKLREVVGKKSELIFYVREETSATSMQSNYDVIPLSDSSLKGILTKSLGVKVVVEKERRLLKLKNARIHLDRVRGLGNFLEFEVVSEGDDDGDSKWLNKLKKLAAPLVLEEINRSYSDLMVED
jgi:adenylate cyclase, class 2